MDTIVIHGKRISEESPKVIAERTYGQSVELWGQSNGNVRFWNGELTDWDRWFNLHPIERTDFYLGVRNARPDTFQWMCEQSPERPIYLIEPHPEVSASIRFPKEDVQAAFPVHGEPCTQFTTTTDWVIAYAVLQQPKRIILDGIGVATDTRFQYLHRGILYWIGFTRGCGIEVIVNLPSIYASPKSLYGYDRIGVKHR